MKKYILITSLVLSLTPIAAKAQVREGMSFGAWCEQRNLIKLEAAHTINVVLNLLNTNNCKTANSLLEERRELNLSKSAIIDLSPLGGLSNLSELNLDDNTISDIKPLINLSNLENLNISNNNISDISALNKIKKLIVLDLSGNKIVHVSGLNSLDNLQELDLSANQITSLSSIAGLVSLRKLKFSNNSIEDINRVDGLTDLISSFVKVELGKVIVISPSEKKSDYITPSIIILVYVGIFLVILLIIIIIKRSNSNNNYSLQTPAFQESDEDKKIFSDIYASHFYYKKDWLALGESLYNLLAYKPAIEAFDRYLAIDPDNYTVWKMRAKSLAELFQYDDAIKSYQSALKIKDMNEYDNAYEAWLEVLRLDGLSEIDDLRSFLDCQDSLQFLEQN